MILVAAAIALVRIGFVEHSFHQRQTADQPALTGHGKKQRSRLTNCCALSHVRNKTGEPSAEDLRLFGCTVTGDGAALESRLKKNVWFNFQSRSASETKLFMQIL